MKTSSAVIFLAAACLSAGAQGIRQGARSPVEKVVNLLKDLQTKIKQDGKVEGQTYDKYACWCEKTTSRKASAITAAQNELRELGQSMLKSKGQVATLASEIDELQQNMQANREAQAEATSIRTKENTAYMAESTEMKEVLAALEKAIIVLRDGTKPTSFLQQGTTASNAVKAVIEALPTFVELKPKHAALLGEFAKVGEGEKYAPQSWTVQGILGDMYDTFSANLESATDTESTRNRDFETFIADKTTQLQAMQNETAIKEGEKADAEAFLADTTQSYDDTHSQKEADVVFFDETKAACESKHNEWVTRSELRTEEFEGIEKALEILTSDSARELFASAIKAGKETGMDGAYDTGMGGVVTSFVQVSGEEAYAPLRDAARRAGSLRLAALAVRVRAAKVGHFDAVISQINAMMQTLRDEDAADIAKRDQCKSEYQKINSTISNVEWLLRKNVAKIDKLTREIEELDAEKARTIEEIQAIDDQLSAMQTQRQEENTAFLNAKADDQAAITLLGRARDVLTSYYSNHSIELGPIQGSVKGMVLAQQGPDFDVSEDQAVDAVFSDKGKRKHESKGIVQLLTMIMEDLNDEIRNGMKFEEIAQLDYEKQVRAANQLRDELTTKKTNLASMIGRRTQDRNDEEADKLSNEGDLQDEKDYKTSITPDCDWIIGAFSGRAEKRAAEMKGLVTAKEYLAGYKPPASLLAERAAAFDDSVLADIHFLGIRQ